VNNKWLWPSGLRR